MAFYYLHKFVRENYLGNDSVYVVASNLIYTYDENARIYTTDGVVQGSNSGALPEIADLDTLLAGRLVSPETNTPNIIRLDDSVHEEDLLSFLGDYNGDLYLDTSQSESPKFVGWSTSNQYSLSPAASSASVSVLSSLGFDNLQKHDVETTIESDVDSLEDELPDLASLSVEDDGKIYLIRRKNDIYDYILREVQWDQNNEEAQWVDLDSNNPYYKIYSTLQYVADSTFYDSVEPTTNQERENRLVNRSLTSLPEPFISGLKLDADIALYRTSDQSELTLNTIDENNAIWVVSDIDGWWNVPQLELPDLPRGWGDGSYDGIGRWTNRLLTLTGSFLVQDPDDAPAARDKLIEYLSPLVKTDGAGYLIVNEGGRRLAAKVRLSGPPSIISVNARGRHDFTVGLKAVDPIKYEFVIGDPNGYDVKTLDPADTITIDVGGSSVTLPGVGGSVPITNTGNVAVPIIVEISNFTNIPSAQYPPRIYFEDPETGIPIIEALENNLHALEIDTYNREVLDVRYSSAGVDGGVVANVANGRKKTSVLLDWVYLEPGENTVRVLGFPSGSKIKIYYRSGWIG